MKNLSKSNTKPFLVEMHEKTKKHFEEIQPSDLKEIAGAGSTSTITSRSGNVLFGAVDDL